MKRDQEDPTTKSDIEFAECQEEGLFFIHWKGKVRFHYGPIPRRDVEDADIILRDQPDHGRWLVVKNRLGGDRYVLYGDEPTLLSKEDFEGAIEARKKLNMRPQKFGPSPLRF